MALLNIEDIQSDHGVGNRDRFPESMKGEVAKDLWHDTKFAYGMEYGYILAILDSSDSRDILNRLDRIEQKLTTWSLYPSSLGVADIGYVRGETER